jgi:SAM-dependent methyltransferase
VHAHQVLQHLTDPVAALREMARVCPPGGLVAVRDVDYAATTWWPPEPGLDRWLDLYPRVARRNGAEPDAGRRLVAWAHAAGQRDLTVSAGGHLLLRLPRRPGLVGRVLGRPRHQLGLRPTGGRLRLADTAALDDVAAAWQRWAASDDGWLGMLHGQLLIRV